jgi:hypothetical protein
VARLKPLDLDQLTRVVDAVAKLAPCELEQVRRYTGLGGTLVRDAVQDARVLGLIRVQGGSMVTACGAGPPGAAGGAREQIVERALERHSGFGMICSLVAEGEREPDQVVRKAAVRLQGMPEDDLRVLVEWGLQVGVLRAVPGTGEIALAPYLAGRDASADGVVPEHPQGSGAARQLVRRWLGDACYASLSDHERDELADALARAKAEPREACIAAGRALEGYLRMLSGSRGIAVSHLHGVGRIAQELKHQNVILGEHVCMCQAVAAVRNAAAHGRSARTNIPWVSTAETALATGLHTLCTIRSVYLWVEEGEQRL